jgi:hypothetical protein
LHRSVARSCSIPPVSAGLTTPILREDHRPCSSPPTTLGFHGVGQDRVMAGSRRLHRPRDAAPTAGSTRPNQFTGT